MFGKRRKKQEWVPWYRRKDYKGDLTEVEKRELDAFRMQEKHPANHYQDLPDEVQSYINALELQVYDFKQEKAVAKPIFASFLGAMGIFLTYKGLGSLGNFGYWLGVLLLTVPWFLYIREWRKNADDEDLHDPDECFRFEWEMDYLHRRRKKPTDTEI